MLKILRVIAADNGISSPGEVLPEFPEPTHSNDPQKTGLIPWTTINESINRIPKGWANHEMASVSTMDNPSFDGNSQAKTMTCSGGVRNRHPSGKRDYTVREYAALQTFPLEHSFADLTKTVQKRQIGNAVPPLFAKCLMEKVVQALKQADGIPDSGPRADRAVGTNTQRHPIRNSAASLSQGIQCVMIN